MLKKVWVEIEVQVDITMSKEIQATKTDPGCPSEIEVTYVSESDIVSAVQEQLDEMDWHKFILERCNYEDCI